MLSREGLLLGLDFVWLFGSATFFAYLWRISKSQRSAGVGNVIQVILLVHFCLELGYEKGVFFYILLVVVPVIGMLMIRRIFLGGPVEHRD